MLVVHPKDITPEIIPLGKIAGIDEIVVTWSPVEPDVPGLISELFGGGNTLRAIRAIVFFAGAAVVPAQPGARRQLPGRLASPLASPGVTHEEREALVQQVFLRITIDGKEFMSIEPKAPYAPLFASIVTSEEFGYWEPNSTPTPDTLLLLPSGITLLGVENWVTKLADVA